MKKNFLVFVFLLTGCISSDRPSDGSRRITVRDNLKQALESNNSTAVDKIINRTLVDAIYKDSVRVPGFAPLLYKAVPFDRKDSNAHIVTYMEALMHKDDIPFVESLVCAATSVEQSLGARLLFSMIKEELGGDTQSACACASQLPMEKTAPGMSIMKARAVCGDSEARRFALEAIKSTGREFRVSPFLDLTGHFYPGCYGEKECALEALAYAPVLDADMIPLLIAKAGVGVNTGYVLVLGQHRVPEAKARLMEIASDVGNKWGTQQTAAVWALDRYNDPQLHSFFLKLYGDFQRLKPDKIRRKNYHLQIALLKTLSKRKDSRVAQILEEATHDTLNTCDPSIPFASCYPVAKAAKMLAAK